MKAVTQILTKKQFQFIKVMNQSDKFTVGELVALLLKEDQNERVVVHGYEEGVNDCEGIARVNIALNVNIASYFGKHEVLDSKADETGIQIL